MQQRDGSASRAGSGNNGPTSRASSGLGGSTTSRLVPNLAAAGRSYPGLAMRVCEDDSESDLSVASATPPLARQAALCNSLPGSASRQGSATRQGSLSTAMERVIHIERKRAGKAYRRNLSSLWSSMHYILRTARCLHAWRSDTVAALKQRQAEKHEAELAALRNNRGDDDFLNETRSLKEQVKQKSATLRDKEDQIDALTWEGRRKDTDLNRLEKENDELRQTVLKHDYELKRQAIQSDTRDELAAKVLLLQELQKRTEADHNRDIASYREQLETNRAEIQLLNAQIREKEQASQTAHQERGAVVDAMHTKLEQQLKHEIQFMNDSMAVLEEKYKLQEEELNKLRQYAPLSQQRELELSKEAGEIKQKLTEQVKQLKANLENVEWERAKQQEELVLTRGAMRRLEDVRESLALKTHELTVAQADIARLTEEARATAKFYHDYEEELKKATKDGDNNEKDTVKTVTQMHEMLIGELRKRHEHDIQDLRATQQEQMKQFETINYDLRRKHDEELNDARRKFQDELNEYRKNMEEELTLVKKAKDEEERQLQLQRIQETQATAANHEAEMSALRSQWDLQMQDLRKQHEDHVKIAIAKDLIVDELERVRNALSRRDEEMVQLQNRYDEERNILFEERLKKEEELAQARAEVKDRDWNQSKQQEELVLLRGTARRWEEDDKSLKEEIQSIRNVCAGKERDCQSLLEQNMALAQESRAKDDKIAQLHSLANEHKDVRTLLQEHDSIVEKFRTEILALQTDNSRLKFASDEINREVNRLRDEVRTKALDLNQMTTKFELDANLFEKALVEQQDQFSNLEVRLLDYQRQTEQERVNQVTQSEEYKIAMERQRDETEQIRNELTQIEDLCKVQTMQLEEARAAALSVESSEWEHAKQQEELVMLRGITRRKDEEKLRLELEISSLNEAIADFEAQLRSKQDEIDAMSEVAQNTLKEQVELTEQAQVRAVAAENEVTDMHRKVESLKQENKEQLKELMAQREDRGADLANKTMEVERLQLHIRTMTEQVEESVGELDKTRTDLALREDDHHLVSEALSSKDEELAKKDEELAKKDEELQAAKTRLQEVCNQLEDAEGQLASAHADLALKEDDNQLVSEAMAKKDEELQTVQVRLQEVCNLLEKTEDQIGGLEQQEIELRNQIKALENDTVKKTHECDSTLWECKKQQEEISTLRALVRRGNDEKARLEKEIQEVQASLGTAHRELRQREDEVNAIAEQVRQQKEEKGEVKNSVIQELKVRHEADIADIQRVCAEGVEELKRMNENTITALKAEHTSKMSDMRAKLQYEVENKTLELKLKLSERNTDLDTAKKQHADIESGLRSSVKELEATLAQTTKEAEEKEKAAKTREVELKGDVEIKTAEMKAMRLSMEEEIATLEKDGAGKLMTIDTLQADLEEAQKLVEESEMKLKEHIANAAREREEKQRELEEKEAQREKERKELEMERERERKERENERDQGMNEIETMKGDSHEKDAIIDKYTALVEDLRSEVEMTRTELLRSEEDRMKVQEDNVMTRGLMRRKEEERQKLESENIKLLEFINHKDQEIGGKDDKIQKLLFEHQAELNAKQDILERLKAEQLELETQISTEREQHKEEQTTMERQHKENTEGLVQRSDHEKRELLREVEQRNLELAQRSKDTSCFLVEIEKLKVELAHAHRDKDDHERNIELRDQELIDFKGKHVSIVEALQIDLRKSEEEVARLLPLLEDLQDQLGSHQEEVGMLRSKEQTWQQELKVKEHTWQQELKEWADKHHVNTDQVRTKEQAIARLESELDSAQEQATILEKQMQDLNDDLEREVASHKTLKEELVMLRGEVRRKGDEMKKMEESQGSLHNSTMERTAAHQDEMEGLWRAMTRKDEEIAELKKASWDAKSKHEDLQKEVEKLSVEAEDKQKRMKELQAMVRGKAQLEKQDLVHSSVKQRKVEDQNNQLLQQLITERSRRQQLQLSWASLEDTMVLICPRLADARFHLVFSAKKSLFKSEWGKDTSVNMWLCGTFAKALNVEPSAISVSHLSWGAAWVGSARSIEDHLQSWAPQVPEGHNLAIALVRFHTLKGAAQSGMQLAERFCTLMKKKGSALYQQLQPSGTNVLGCLPPQKTLEGEERLLPSEVAAKMVVVEDLGFSLFQDETGNYLISYVLAGSLASEYEKVAPGDLVKEIDGVQIHKRPVYEVNKLLTGRPGGTVAMLLCRAQDLTTKKAGESNLVIMARPSVAPSPSPLAKARASMMHPDVSELISMGDLNVSIAAQPSFDGTGKHLDFDDSIILDANGLNQGEQTSQERAEQRGPKQQPDTPASTLNNHSRSLGSRTASRNASRSPERTRAHSTQSQLSPEKKRALEEAEERRAQLEARLRGELEAKKAELEAKLRQESPLKSRSAGGSKPMSEASPLNTLEPLEALEALQPRTSRSKLPLRPRTSSSRSPARSPPRSPVRAPVRGDGVSDLEGARGVPVQWDTLDI